MPVCHKNDTNEYVIFQNEQIPNEQIINETSKTHKNFGQLNAKHISNIGLWCNYLVVHSSTKMLSLALGESLSKTRSFRLDKPLLD